MKKSTVITEVKPMSSKDSIALSKSSTALNLEEVVRAFASLSVLGNTVDEAKKALQEKLNAFSKADIDAAFNNKAVLINGKTYQVIHKESVSMDYNIDTLTKLISAQPYLKTVPSYSKLDQSAFIRDLSAGSVDPKVSSAIVVTTVETNVFKEVK